LGIRDTLVGKSHKNVWVLFKRPEVGCHSSETNEDRNKLERPDDAGEDANQLLY
jgi:hypothetical protein